MKSVFLKSLLLGILTLTWNQFDPGTALMLSAPQTGASHLPPDAPPGGPPMPGEPIMNHPEPPRMPTDFLDTSDKTKSQRPKMDSVQTQKDAEELKTLANKVQGEVNQLAKSVLPKDLDQDLKHIQKLAKRLRGEITP